MLNFKRNGVQTFLNIRKNAIMAVTGAAVLGLGSCGLISDKQKPTLTKPIDASDDFPQPIAAFLETCSAYVLGEDPDDVTEILEDADWPEEAEFEFVYEDRPDAPEDWDWNVVKIGSFTLQLMTQNYPHQETHTCLLLGPLFDNKTLLDALDDVEDINGLEGDFELIKNPDLAPEKELYGNWSAIGPDGRPIIVSARGGTDRFFQLIMSASSPEKPSKN